VELRGRSCKSKIYLEVLEVEFNFSLHTFKFEAVKDGKVVQTVVKSAVGSLALDV
jgi:hypothetical protein